MSTQDSTAPEQDAWTFRGFSSPNTTPVPDEFFDVIAPRLKEAELRVTLYIIRRTFGFKKTSDDISLRQMVEGIRTRDGRVLDYGTGLSKPAVIRAVRTLVDRGIILAAANQSREKGFEATTYRLNVLESAASQSPLLTKFTSPSKRKELALVNESNIQETVLQETDKQLTDSHNSNIRMASTPELAGKDLPPEPSDDERGARSATSVETVGSILRRTKGKPSGPRRSRPRPETETEEWEAIQAHITDFARQLGDTASLKSSTTRAYNLFVASGLSLTAFIDKLFQARALTQERSASITKMAEDPTYRTYRKTKMAYFFAVLEDQLKPVSNRREGGSAHAGA